MSPQFDWWDVALVKARGSLGHSGFLMGLKSLAVSCGSKSEGENRPNASEEYKRSSFAVRRLFFCPGVFALGHRCQATRLSSPSGLSRWLLASEPQRETVSEDGVSGVHARDPSQSSACSGPPALPSPCATHDKDWDPQDPRGSYRHERALGNESPIATRRPCVWRRARRRKAGLPSCCSCQATAGPRGAGMAGLVQR